MKKSKLLLVLSVISILSLTGCSPKAPAESVEIPDPSGQTSGGGEIEDVEVPETGEEPEVNVNSSFSIETSDGEFTQNGSVYTISKAGTYSLKGKLDGQILVNAGDDDKVELEFNGVSISYDLDSPIKVLNADKVEISAKKNSSNSILDNRAAKTVDSDSQGEGAISAKCDLKLKGTGTLVVEGNYNNGVHTTKDLEIQKETLYIVAYNNAIKGKCSISIASGNITAVSKTGNGLKTDRTNQSSKGKQRGTITISGGTLLVDSAQDAIDAAYDLIVEEADASTPTVVNIKTGKNSTYKANYNSSKSSKGLKADNEITISAGTITIATSDDSIHANYGQLYDEDDGVSTATVFGQGIINVTGGTIGVAAGDDGLHADNQLNISGGKINISGAVEGIEANHINISGGETHIYGSDDGVNASKKIDETPTIVVSGGFLDVSMATGDTDGIDSNGNFTQTGGLIVSRGGYGSAGRMSTGLDVDGTAVISGGTFIAFNGTEKTPTKGSGVLYAYYGSTGNGGGWNPGGPGGGPGGPGWRAVSSYPFQAGTYTLTGTDFSKTFTNQYNYAAFLIYSSELVIGNTYTLANGTTTVLSWTQTSSSQQITL